eukprot:CAMPEP_0182907518 /NCGR_PEP_ID=MMETSP0034_2-20130328/34546_1 /TAXON_ID=156128 /ORGANISM="Nephroselmis pyriformis, Strain CCMP717" /LENGTH=45 /DNA_ID= /DNA_START= /DNA_END= /DNA_ORIENTATION=
MHIPKDAVIEEPARGERSLDATSIGMVLMPEGAIWGKPATPQGAL